ncbi:MAG: pyruvate carboxylase [Planctomycetota bacterium]|jgi:pyruvate carboxylase
MPSAPVSRLLVANRGEIAIRVFRSAHELGIRTIAVYTHEDRYALHRFKADEAYPIGTPGEPIRAYLDIESIVGLARKRGVEAIHPGYGFLSEKPAFARACADAGILFIGPRVDVLERLGDKTTAREIAREAGVPILEGTPTLADAEAAASAAERLGYPIILKAAKGGGGRGMRIVREPSELADSLDQAQREALVAFGSSDVFAERLIEEARHIEVQLLGDKHGGLVHLGERDCTVQRRHQKVVELAPAPYLDDDVRAALHEAAVAIGRAAGYDNAGTVEFLVDRRTGDYFFIEVNPRIQVEHTVTEAVSGVDIVRAQIQIAAGAALGDPDIGLASQDDLHMIGYAMQCRVTTEDPANDFMPDYGRVDHYRSASGMGVRLDAGSAFSGAIVNPFYDSLLVKVTTQGRRFADAASRMERCLQEFRVRGVKTNIPFLVRLVTHPKFLCGDITTRFIDHTPELFDVAPRQDRATRLLSFLGEMIVNGNPIVADRPRATRREPAPRPAVDPAGAIPDGTRTRLLADGPEAFARWVKEQGPLLITDTTFRDAHQSLLATRLRTRDLVEIADAYARLCPGLFSIEMWGGATFDVAMRFLKECPWQRLAELRERIPNILFQMLLRASNAVGYTNYPDNVVRAFVKEAAAGGIDVFRVFDALNWVPNMRVAMEAVLETGAICEASICYSGDILDPARTKYDLDYYVKLARDLESMGAHILAIKDMAGLCKPAAAAKLVRALRDAVDVPIHFHTHDTAGIQAAAVLGAAEEGLDVADAAMAPLSGGTAQPNLNTLVAAMASNERRPDLDPAHLDEIAAYWRAVREFYLPFESEVLPASSDLYRHEMPGGQYTNLIQQARALGLADRWSEICRVYADVNEFLGDIVKVTPTSKAVGDLALFLIANDLSVADLARGDRELAVPASVIDLVGGRMGQPPGGFPDEAMRVVLRGEKPMTGRPGEELAPADFDAAAQETETLLGRAPRHTEVVSRLLYPKVFDDFVRHEQAFGDTSGVPTPSFFYGLEPGEEIAVDIEPGKTLIVKFLTVGEARPDGTRTVFFELNGQPRDVTITDHALDADVPQRRRADAGDDGHVGASMPGMVVTVAAQVGDGVKKGQKLLTLEAMKMETTVYAERDGTVGEVLVSPGSQVDTGDLLLTLE